MYCGIAFLTMQVLSNVADSFTFSHPDERIAPAYWGPSFCPLITTSPSSSIPNMP
jgi:hypothetical protein